MEWQQSSEELEFVKAISDTDRPKQEKMYSPPKTYKTWKKSNTRSNSMR